MFKFMFASCFVLITVNRKHFAQAQNPPLNAAANVGDRVVVNCSTGASVIPGWRYSPTGSVPYTSISYAGDCSSLLTPRFVVEPAGNTGCNLIIPNATTEDALAYQCDDGRAMQYFMLLTIIESVEVSPNNRSTVETCEDDPLNITCTVNYSSVSTSTLQMFPSIMWTNLSTNANISGSTPSPMPPNVTTSYLSIVVTPPTVPSYSCNVYFNAPNLPLGYAPNAPNYSRSASTNQLKVQYLSESADYTSNVTTSSCVNETVLLTCVANGHPEPSYRWTNAATNKTISNTKEAFINSGGHYVCVVSSNVCNSTTTLQASCNNDPKCATCSSVSGAVISYDDTKVGKSVDLTCNANGLPEPMYEWKRDDIKEGDGKGLTVSENGNVTCVAYNFINGVRNSDNYTVSITEIVQGDGTKDSTIIIIVICVCGWIVINLIVSGISFVIYKRHKVIMNGKFPWLKKMLPFANSKDENDDYSRCKKILWILLCVVTSIFVAVIVYPILFAIAGCPCCRKSHQETSSKRNSRNGSTRDYQSGTSLQEMSSSTGALRQAAPRRPDLPHQADPYHNQHVNSHHSRPPSNDRTANSPSPVSASAVEYGELKIDAKPGSRKPVEFIIQNESNYAELQKT